jgi:hypothetical protein
MAHGNANNLERHYQKHPAGLDEKCWMDLLNTSTRVEKSEYEAESKKVINTAWIVYRAAKLNLLAWWDAKANPDPPLHPEGLYYTDARLVRTITNVHNDEIRTCHHEHLDRPHEMRSGSIREPRRGLLSLPTGGLRRTSPNLSQSAWPQRSIALIHFRIRLRVRNADHKTIVEKSTNDGSAIGGSCRSELRVIRLGHCHAALPTVVGSQFRKSAGGDRSH